MKKSVLIALLSCLGIFALNVVCAPAQDFQIGIGIPAEIEDGEIGFDVDAGVLFDVDYGEFLFGAEVIYYQSEERYSQEGNSATGELDTLAGLAIGRFYTALDSEGRFQVFFGAGVGLGGTDGDFKVEGKTFSDDSDFDLVFQANVGAEYGITETVFIKGEYKFMYVGGLGMGTATLDNYSANLIEGGLNIKF